MNDDLDLRNPDAVCAVLGLDAPEVWRKTWPASAGSFPAGPVFFLDPDYVTATCAQLGISAAVTAALGECAAALAADEAGRRLAWHLHWLVSLSGLEVGSWPAPPEEGHFANNLLYAVVCLAGVPRMLEINAARGIELADSIETLSDIETWSLDHFAWNGQYRFTNLGWLQHHLRGQLLKLGRLEYVPGGYGHPFRWYREAASGQVIALAEDGLLLRQDGQFASADGGEMRAGLWRTRFVETVENVTGSPVSPWGRVLADSVTLDTAQWIEILRPGDPVLTVHIPSQGSLSPEECGASFRQAVEVYRQHYPEVVWRAFTCHSWLLDPQFERFNPAPKNVCAFLREWYLHPVEGADDAQAFQRVFDLFGPYGQVKWDEVEAETSLQRAAVEFVKQGGHPRQGGSVLFAEDLEWGEAVYRNRLRSDLIQGA